MIKTYNHSEPQWPWMLLTMAWIITIINNYETPHTYEDWINLSYPVIQGVIGCGTVWIISIVKANHYYRSLY